MTDTPFDQQVRRLAWRVQTKREVDALAAENDPGVSDHGRAKAVGERARKAGWPQEHVSQEMQREARRRYKGRVAAARAYKRRAREGLTAVRDEVAQPATIFDE